MTLEQLRDNIARRIRDATTATATVIDECAQDTLDTMLMKIGPSVLERVGTIRTVSGQSTYALRPDVSQIISPMIIPEQSVVIREVRGNELDRFMPEMSATGIPQVFYSWGSRGVEKQPESKVHLVSNSASDTQDIAIYGVSGGIETSETVTLTGTTAVLTTKTYSLFTKKAEAESAAVGTITATMNSPTTGDGGDDPDAPNATAAGVLTVFTITAGNTTPTNQHNPGSIVRLRMDQNAEGDRSKAVIVEGYAVSAVSGGVAADKRDRIYVRSSISTSSTATTEAQGTVRYHEIISVTKSWDATGTLVVMVDPDQTIVAMIPAAQRSLNFPQVTFYPQPTGQSIQYRYVAQQPRLGTGSAADDYQPPWAQRYDNIWLAFTEKMVRAFKQAQPYDLRTDVGFLEAMKDAVRMSERHTPLIMGGGWQTELERPWDFPITP